jgi:NhaP-type Na+/H+ or K+/H+ antiporter
MNSFPAILASSGGHDYLYGLFFLIVALVIGAATRQFLKKVPLPLPFTVLLLIIGLVIGFLNRNILNKYSGHHESSGFFADLWHKILETLSGAITWGGNLDGHLILYVFLPILIFEAGFALDVHTFKKSFLNAFYLAGPGIVSATVMTGLAFYGLIVAFGDPSGFFYEISDGVLSEWRPHVHGHAGKVEAFVFLASMLFGAVVSATDPVAVVALLKELGASKKLGTLIEGESLLNDGTAIVAFVLLFGVVTGSQFYGGLGSFLGDAALGFGQIGAAGGLLGVLLGLLAILWVRKVFNDPLIEVTVVLVTSFAVFFICEHFFHVSGVLGLVALGIVLAGVGRTRISPEVEHFMHEFWEFIAFVANVIIFIVVGVVIAQKVDPTKWDFLILGLVYVIIHLVRAINMGVFYPLMRKAGYGLPPRDAVVVWWGALRGAIGLALALVVYSAHLEFKFGDFGDEIEFADTKKKTIGKKSSFILKNGQDFKPETTSVHIVTPKAGKKIDDDIKTIKNRYSENPKLKPWMDSVKEAVNAPENEAIMSQLREEYPDIDKHKYRIYRMSKRLKRVVELEHFSGEPDKAMDFYQLEDRFLRERYLNHALDSIASVEVNASGSIQNIFQTPKQFEDFFKGKSSQEIVDLRAELEAGKKLIKVIGEGTGFELNTGALKTKDKEGKGIHFAGVAIVGISDKVRGQFLFLISGIVLLTLLVNATTVGPLVNALGLTKLPAVKKLMFSNASGNVAKGCEEEMDLLKDDRFLSGANWSEVRNYLPDPVAYPLTADELAEMDTLAEIRRRLLERERSSYWSQFRSGLLSARAVASLDNNLSEFVDKQGKVPMTERGYLEKVCGVSKLTEAFKDLPFLKSFFSDRITVSYDAAKAFVVSQQDIAKMVDTLAKDLDESGDPKKLQQNTRLLKDEIRQNRLAALHFIRDMHENYPEATVGIETKDAIRSVLNHERNAIRKLKSEGMLESDEAARLITEVEQRMKDVMDSPLELRLPEPEEVLREVNWLKGMPEELIAKIIAVSEERAYSTGDSIMKQGDDGDGMIVITRGSVQVSIGDLVVDIMGRGSVIGEMAVLAGIKRTANVVADSSVTALWLNTESMQKVIAESPQLSGSLWKTAAMRFAENLLGSKSPYNQWDQMRLRRWLNGGDVFSPADGESLDLYGKVAVLVAGQASSPSSSEPKNAPALLDLASAEFSGNAKVFIRES